MKDPWVGASTPIHTPLLPVTETEIRKGVTVVGKSFSICRHRPTLVLHGRNPLTHRRWEVWGGSESKVEDRLWEFDLIVNCTGSSLGRMRNIIPEAVHLNRWRAPLASREIVLDWKDFSSPNLPLQFWRDLLKVIARRNRTLVFCTGGHGRTGTCLSSLLTVQRRIDGAQAVGIIRKTYCEKAVENERQAGYVERLGEILKH